MNPRDYAMLAQAAYSATPDYGDADGAARAILRQTDAGTVLCLRGTDNLASLLADADALPHDAGPIGLVHAGIWHAFDTLWPAVSQLTPHALAGHSEGAAGAIYLGARLCLAGHAPAEIWAFEPPHTVLDDKLSALFAAHGVKVMLYRHGNDLVTMAPVALPGLGWRHCAPVIGFGRAASVLPNLEDHRLDGVIGDLG